MTNEINPSVQVEPTPIPPASQMSFTSEQVVMMKQSLIQQLIIRYHEFIKSIASMPTAKIAMNEAFKHFDTGFLWFKESIEHMPITPVELPQNPPVNEPIVSPPEAA